MSESNESFEKRLRRLVEPMAAKSPELKQAFDEFFAKPTPTAVPKLGDLVIQKKFAKFRKALDEFFISLFGHPDDKIASASLFVFQQHSFPKQSVYQLEIFFNHENPKVRAAAISAANSALPGTDQTLLPQFAVHLTDSDPVVRMSALDALGDHKAASYVPNMLALIGDSDRRVRWSVYCALRSIDEWGKKHVRPHLARIEPFLSNPDDKIKTFAADLMAYYTKGAYMKGFDAY